MAQSIGRTGSAGGRPRLDAGAVALARGHAVVPQLGAGAVGDMHGVAQQAYRPVLLSLDEGVLVALHAFIKKTQKTPDDELALARRRQKEMKS